MPPIKRSLVITSLMRHEGLELHPYVDTVGKLTIGYGRNLDDKGISQQEAVTLLENDVTEAIQEALRAFPWLPKLDEARAAVIVEMVAHLGLPRFLGFKKALSACAVSDWETAAKELLDSTWRTQVGARAYRLAEQLRTGKITPV
jgi:lysozyme